MNSKDANPIATNEDLKLFRLKRIRNKIKAAPKDKKPLVMSFHQHRKLHRLRVEKVLDKAFENKV